MEAVRRMTSFVPLALEEKREFSSFVKLIGVQKHGSNVGVSLISHSPHAA